MKVRSSLKNKLSGNDDAHVARSKCKAVSVPVLSNSGRVRSRRGSTMAEFGPVLWVFLIMVVVPLFDLIGFATAAGTVMMMADFGARQASGAMKGTDAYNSAQAMNTQLAGFLAFSKATPSPGMTVQIQITQIGSTTPAISYPLSSKSQSSNSTPYNSSYVTDAENPSGSAATYTYQYLVTANYQVMPLFNFSGIQPLRNIPGLGQPVTVTYTRTSNVEHPEGLTQ